MADERLPATILVIFGISGDLSHRYLLPALKNIARMGKLPKELKIIGVSRRNISVSDVFSADENGLSNCTEMIQVDLSDQASYATLKSKINDVSEEFNTKPEIIFYLSVPPDGVLEIIKNLGRSGLNTADIKLLLEKPFGIDLASAQKLINETHKCFPEDQVYRIDHYLAKEMAQNIVVFLGSNTLFRSVWSNQFIENIEIDAAEEIGIEGRANFYDPAGALRDMVQSHLLQLTALTLMEPCSKVFEFSELPPRRLAALRSLKVDLSQPLVRGQYEGYKKEASRPNSHTETFASINLVSDNPRWRGVPIRLTTGKKLNERLTEIRVYFKKLNASEENSLILRVQPHEAIEIQLWVKQPGYERSLQRLPLEFTYKRHFGNNLPGAYEQVLIDAIQSNHSLFASSGEVLESWRILKPVQDKWAKASKDLVIYEPGSTIDKILESPT